MGAVVSLPTVSARRIRLASVKDLEALCRLEQLGFATDRFSLGQFHYLLTQAHATALLLELGGGVRAAAILLWRRDASLGRLYSIVVDPAYRGRGLAGLLLEACERACLAHGCDRLGLEVRADNGTAIAFYLRKGFRAARSLAAYYDDGCDGLKMLKKLDSSAFVPAEAVTLRPFPERAFPASEPGVHAGAGSGA